jgi:hypothetical protein
MKNTTIDAIRLQVNGEQSAVLAEFGRWQDVQRLFGIKRGTLYNLIAEGKVKSVVLRRKGNVHGCRIIHLASVSGYLNSLMQEQNGGAHE